MKKIPFFDLKKEYFSIKNEIDKAFIKVVESGNFTLGQPVLDFEQDFAKFCGAKYAIGVSSGTAALHLALLSLGIGSGDEVITVSHTFIATVEAISYIGAKTIFVDIDPKTYNIDPKAIEKVITSRTKAIIPVHLYGQSADLDLIRKIADKHKLFIIEDACQAHGAEYKGKKVGAIGDIGCFSFYPSKNLGAYGEAGCLTTNNFSLAEKAKALRNHGSNKKYYHDVIGYNYRMESIQGAFLMVKLKHIETWISKRIRIAQLYNHLLADIPEIICPYEAPYGRHVYYLYVIRVLSKKRNNLRAYLEGHGVETGIHYPLPIHLQKAFGFLKIKKGAYPVTEKYAEEILSLPMYPELTLKKVTYISRSIKEFFTK